MNNTFFVAASSAALGAVITLLLVPRPEPVARSTPMTVGLLRSSVQQALETVLNQPGATEIIREQPRPSTAPSPARREATAPVAAATKTKPGAPEPPMDVTRAEELRLFNKDELIRRRWIFKTEREVLRELGTPTEVSVQHNGATETWAYKWDNRRVYLDFRRGELYRVRP